jgi:hypothetical protein
MRFLESREREPESVGPVWRLAIVSGLAGFIVAYFIARKVAMAA